MQTFGDFGRLCISTFACFGDEPPRGKPNKDKGHGALKEPRSKEEHHLPDHQAIINMFCDSKYHFILLLYIRYNFVFDCFFVQRISPIESELKPISAFILGI